MKNENITVTIPIEVYNRLLNIEKAFNEKKIYLDIQETVRRGSFCDYTEEYIYILDESGNKNVIIDFAKELKAKDAEKSFHINNIYELQEKILKLEKRKFVFNPFADFCL